MGSNLVKINKTLLVLLLLNSVNQFAGVEIDASKLAYIPDLPVKSFNKPAEHGVERLFKAQSFDGKSRAELVLKGTVDFFYGDHINFFSASPLDQVFYAGSNWDAIFDAKINEEILFKLNLRTNAKWGNEQSTIKTTLANFKIGDAVTGTHDHAVPRLAPWVREGWVDFSVNQAFSMDEDVLHRFRIGSFPFSLGRGISLGSAFSASQGFLGFCSSNVIEQFAFGTLLYGDIIKNQLAYNAYVGFLENYSDSFSRVNEIVNENRMGNHYNAARGFGIINFVFACNLKWKPLEGSVDSGSDLEIEPYLMYNHAPQQLVQTLGDARCKLGTFGLCMEYTGSRFEWGFDTAFNAGSQYVYGLDRNQVETFVDDDGQVKNQYTKVLVGSSTGPNAVETRALKALLNGPASGQGVSLNRQLIGTINETTCCGSGPVSYYNANNRFRPDYTNALKGIMLAMDAAYSLREDQSLKVVVTAAWATGDENPNQAVYAPNQNEFSGDYNGFIGLQEIYSGKRVESLFLIGNNSVVRPLSTPTFVSDPSDIAGIYAPARVGFASIVGGFTNIAFIGGGFDLKTSVMGKKWRVRPSVLSYWEDRQSQKFDVNAQISIAEPADKHLGVEVNTTVKVDLVGELSGYLIGGIFIPGKHYDDVKGTPLNNVQADALRDLDSTGFPVSGIPVLGTSPAIALNWGLDICF